MGVVLGKRAHAHEPVQSTGRLVAMHLAKLGEADRQFAVAPETMLENLHMTGAIHRLDGIHPLIRRLGEEHVLTELLEVPRLTPEARIHELRRVHFLVTGRVLPPAHVADERLKDQPALGMPEHCAGRLLLQVEKIKFATDSAVIALLGFLEPMQIFIELLLVHPRRAVNSLQHRVARVAAPIGTRNFCQLEGFQPPRGGHVRPAAQVDPVALPVEADLVRAGMAAMISAL